MWQRNDTTPICGRKITKHYSSWLAPTQKFLMLWGPRVFMSKYPYLLLVRGWSHRLVLTLSFGISGYNDIEGGGPTSISQHDHQLSGHETHPAKFNRMIPSTKLYVVYMVNSPTPTLYQHQVNISAHHYLTYSKLLRAKIPLRLSLLTDANTWKLILAMVVGKIPMIFFSNPQESSAAYIP